MTLPNAVRITNARASNTKRGYDIKLNSRSDSSDSILTFSAEISIVKLMYGQVLRFPGNDVVCQVSVWMFRWFPGDNELGGGVGDDLQAARRGSLCQWVKRKNIYMYVRKSLDKLE